MSEWKETDLGLLPDDWEMTTLDKLVNEERGISYGVVQPGFHNNQGVPIIRVNNIKDGRFLIDEILRVDNDIEKNYQRTRLRGGELLITLVGNLGECAIVTKAFEGWNVARAIGVIDLNRKKVIPEWIKYLLSTTTIKSIINSWANTTVQATLNLKELNHLPISLPSLPEQQSIAAILSSLDNKIDLLRRQNQTLEQLSQTIFKQWFVQFQYPGAIGKMQQTELGEVPMEWRLETFDRVADFLNGIALQKFPPENEEDYLPVIKIRELKSGITDVTDRASNSIDEKYIIKNGEILFSWSGSLEVVIWNYGKGALNQHLFKVTSEKYPKWFYYLWLLHHLPKFKHIAQGKATTMGHIQRHHLTETIIPVPPTNLLKEFDKTFSPILNKVISNAQEIQTLTQLRDSLLPRLMSGKLRVG